MSTLNATSIYLTMFHTWVKRCSKTSEAYAQQATAIARILGLEVPSRLQRSKPLLLTSVIQAHYCTSGVPMSIPRNTDVKKHLARSIPPFVAKKKDGDKPLPVLVESGAPVEYSKAEKAVPKVNTR